jgi:multicomponent Na+:H+ antiporter subunit E
VRNILLNLVLAVAWCALAGNYSEWNFVAGLLVGAFVVELYTRALQSDAYLARGLRLLGFLMYFLKILLIANLQVMWECITPGMSMTPRIVRYPIGGLSDVERTTLANAITLTPGTLVIDISPDNNWLYIHCMYAKDREKAIRALDELALRLRKGVFT